jgi:hypothetical protein
MQGSIVPQQTIALLKRSESEFKRMSLDSATPGLGCVLSFLAGFEQEALKEVPSRAEQIASVCKKWGCDGIAASEKRGALEINWGAPDVIERLFKELADAVGVV